MSEKMTAGELEKVNLERRIQSFFSRDARRAVALNAYRYLEKNGAHDTMSESAIEMISNIALAFAAGELDWVKGLER